MVSRAQWPDRGAAHLVAALRGPATIAQAATLAVAARRLRRDQDPDAIHDLRVAVRRLEAMLRFEADRRGVAIRPRVRRRLRALRRRLGPVREREVLVALFDQHRRPHLGTGPDPLTGVRKRLLRRAQEAREAAGRWATARRVGSIIRAVDREANRICAVAPGAEATEVPAGTRRADLESKAREGLAAAARSQDDETLHAVRLAVKRWRYFLECAAASGEEATAATLTLLRDLQRCVGTALDVGSLDAVLERHARRWRARGRQEKAAAAAALRFELARERSASLARFVALAASVGPAPPRRAS